jgi:hypothetical protein
MRNLIFLVALAGAGCNDDNLGGMSDMTVLPDLSPVKDLAMRMPNGIACGTSTCNDPQVCCVRPGMGGGMASLMCMAPGSCGDGGAELMCDGPEDCPVTTGNCCITAKLTTVDMGAIPNAANAACASDADCPASADIAGSMATIHSKLCHVAGDCAGYSGTTAFGTFDFTSCCTAPQAPGLHFCAPSQVTALLMGAMCN